jgi:hypothetical protein
MSVNKVSALLICSLFSIAVDAGSLSDKMKNDKSVGEVERKQRELKDSLVIQQYDKLIRNIFKEGTLIRIRRDKDDDYYGELDVWHVRDKLLFVPTPKNGEKIRSVRVCGGKRPWVNNSSSRKGLILETTPKILATGKGNVFEFKKGDYSYEIDPVQKQCLYMHKYRQQVKNCRFEFADQASHEQYLLKQLQDVRDKCESFYGD